MLTFKIPGKCIPKSRPRFAKGRVFTPKKTQDYEKRVKDFASIAMYQSHLPIIENDVQINIKFVFENKKHGDIDNLLKSVLDGLNGVVFDDDRQIKQLSAQIIVGMPSHVVVNIA